MSEAKIASRLEKLERDNRRLKGFALATMILAAALGAIYATQPVPQVIRAHTFEVIDNSGKVRAKMTVSRSGKAEVAILDARGNARAVIGESSIDLTDAQSRWGVTLAVDELGERVEVLGPHLGTAMFGVDLLGSPSVILNAANDDGHAEMAISPSGRPTVTLNSAHGTGHAGIIVSPSGEPAITLDDSQGYSMDLGNTQTVMRTTGETQQTSAASIVMFGNDKDHHVIWQAP